MILVLEDETCPIYADSGKLLKKHCFKEQIQQNARVS